MPEPLDAAIEAATEATIQHAIESGRTDADGNNPCSCGEWWDAEGEPGWDEHMAEVAVRAAEPLLAQAHTEELDALKAQVKRAQEYASSRDKTIATVREEAQRNLTALSEATEERDAARAEADQMREQLAQVRARLSSHYLAQIVCDHDRRLDNPVCACSLVHLGWHPSVGAAVAAWVEHVLAADGGALGVPAFDAALGQPTPATSTPKAPAAAVPEPVEWPEELLNAPISWDPHRGPRPLCDRPLPCDLHPRSADVPAAATEETP